VEGAVDEGGRGPSIWDTFCRTPGKVRGGDTGDVACDQYHRYPEDVALMAELGLGAYRFSVAWPRIQPDGRGPANPAGLDHYHRLVDELNRHGIEPVLTLYHWDLPQALEDSGGWAERETAERFAEYAAIVHRSLAGEVRYWITVNEPWVAAWLGYGTGVHAPGRTDDALAFAATHHQLLAHGLASEAMGDAGGVGIAVNPQPAVPATDAEADVRAAHLADLHMNALFLDPLFGRGYPPELVDRYRGETDLGFVRDDDLRTIARPLGFLGVNYYRIHTVAAAPPPGREAEELPGGLGAWSFAPPDVGVTSMGWPVEPHGLADLLRRIHLEYAPDRILVTENGAAFEDFRADDGSIDDPNRISFLRDHLAAAADAIAGGVPLHGYFVWSLVDNFEWAQGYAQRFGLVYVDHATQERIPKQSAWWFKGVIRREGPRSAGERRPSQDRM
jgi:beta-glucosidase